MALLAFSPPARYLLFKFFFFFLRALFFICAVIPSAIRRCFSPMATTAVRSAEGAGRLGDIDARIAPKTPVRYGGLIIIAILPGFVAKRDSNFKSQGAPERLFEKVATDMRRGVATLCARPQVAGALPSDSM